MKNIIVSFTDAYGITHSDAVVEVSYGNKSFTNYETIGDSPSVQTQLNATMQYRFWHSVDSKAAGALPLPFVAKDGRNTFGTMPTQAEVEDFELYCLTYFATVIMKEEGGAVVVDESQPQS
jgi:hypothetical protein